MQKNIFKIGNEETTLKKIIYRSVREKCKNIQTMKHIYVVCTSA